MKKVFLVDDEIIIREGIRDRIDWTKEGYLYCGDAPDGEIALPLIEEIKPDILITDIKMPFMDGLELSKIVRQKLPSTKIIILSGHDEFQYAREALRIGVTEYCVKPVSASDLLELLQLTSKQIDIHNKERNEVEALKRKMDENQILSKEKLLSDLCFGLISTIDAMQAAAAMKFSLLSRYYTIVLAECDSIESVKQLFSAVYEEINEFVHRELHPKERELHFRRNKKEHAWIVKGESPEDIKETLQHFTSLKTQAEKAFACTFTIGVGSIQDRLQGIPQAYTEAEEDKNFQSLSRKYQLSQFKEDQEPFEHFIYLDRNKFIDFLKLGHASDTDRFTREYAVKLQNMDWRNAFYGYYLLMDFTSTMIQYIQECYKEHERILTEIQQIQKKITQIHDGEAALEFIQTLIHTCISFREGLTDKHSNMIQKVKDFIGKNYNVVDLSLQMVSDHVNVSPGHLSTVFSHETGQTFIEYLTNTRIRKAMELLKSTHDKSYEIAYRVGYHDSHYFSNLFKKTTGMTTKDFRKKGMAARAEALTEDQ